MFKNLNKYIINPIDGTVFSKKYKKYLGYKGKDGYIHISLIDNGKRYNYQLHRLIYESVYGEIPDGYDVHHIDHNPSNNSINNLIMLDSRAHLSLHNRGESNPMFGKRSELNHRSKACAKLDKDTEEVLEILPCIADFERKYGYLHQKISQCCVGKSLTYKGYKWKHI